MFLDTSTSRDQFFQFWIPSLQKCKKQKLQENRFWPLSFCVVLCKFQSRELSLQKNHSKSQKQKLLKSKPFSENLGPKLTPTAPTTKLIKKTYQKFFRLQIWNSVMVYPPPWLKCNWLNRCVRPEPLSMLCLHSLKKPLFHSAANF